VPGRVVDFQADTGRLLTMEELTEPLDLTQEQCYAQAQLDPGVRVSYVPNAGGDYVTQCERFENRISRVQLLAHGARRLSSVALDGDEWRLSATAITSERVFVKQQNFRTVTQANPDGSSYSYLQTAFERTAAFDADLNPLGTTEQRPSTWSDLRARGKLAFSSDSGSLLVVDATDPAQIATRSIELLGYGCDDLEVRGNTAVCSHGMQGVEVLKVK